MATEFRLEIDDKGLKALHKLRQQFPEIMARTLGYIGSKGRIKLKQEYLSGQELNLRKFPTDKIGRPTISYSIARKVKYLRIFSYPLNLFEKGRKLRSGRMEPGKYILTRKFKRAFMGQLQSIVNEFDDKIIQGEMDKI